MTPCFRPFSLSFTCRCFGEIIAYFFAGKVTGSAVGMAVLLGYFTQRGELLRGGWS
jgi:putative effector of murein hydrolase LrgA (UPF0299 family)